MTNQSDFSDAADRIYHLWDQALSNNDVEGLLALYDPESTLESPLVPYLLEQEKGVCYGHKDLRRLFELLADRKPDLRKYYRTPCLKHGNLIMWEYPRKSPNGEQMDFAEIMQLNDDGLIQSHRVYWGWRGVKVLSDDAYRRS